MKITTFLFQLVGYEEEVKLFSLRLRRLWKKSGSNFTFLYMKESVRLTIRSLAGAPEPRFLAKGVYVSRDPRGLPNILPKKLRDILYQSMSIRNDIMVKFILSIMSIYRVFPSVQRTKLMTITGHFTGISRVLDSDRVREAVEDLGIGALHLRPMKLLKLETASPYAYKST